MSNEKELTQEEMGDRFDNPIMKNQITGNQFVEDKRGEIRLKGNFVGETGYVSLDDVVQEVRDSRKSIILNIGDSSTSGWDSDVVSLNREIKQRKGLLYDQEKDAIFPIFNYRTYSDCLRDIVGNQYVVVNAGVPTHTSLNGLRRLKELVKDFRRAGVTIDYVTAYYGNNDSVCNGNVEEKNRVGIFGKLRRILSPVDQDYQIVTRTNVEDFAKNMREIAHYCRVNNIFPILIEPAVPLYWEPGRRVKRKTEFDEDDAAIRAVPSRVEMFYRAACIRWENGNKAFEEGATERAIKFYEEAKEKDYITPRIKNHHVQALQYVSTAESVPLVQVDIPRDRNDGKKGEGYFGDYCHPIERANKLYAEEIRRVVMTAFYQRQNRENKSDVSDKMYPLW